MDRDWLAEAVTEAVGERCADFDAECIGCATWKALDEERTELATLRQRIEELEQALDIDAVIDAAALAWCGQKERETFPSDIAYFRDNWRALPGLTDFVDRELGRRARAALGRKA